MLKIQTSILKELVMLPKVVIVGFKIMRIMGIIVVMVFMLQRRILL